MRVGIIGGTGSAGQSLALRLAAAGHEVIVGSRDIERAGQVVTETLARWPTRELEIRPGTNVDAGSCEIAVLSTPWEAAVTTALALSEVVESKVVVSMVNALARVGNEFQALVPARGSIAASVQGVLPKSFVTTAFQHLPAREFGQIDRPAIADVVVCSDTQRGYDETQELVESVDGLRAVFGGSLASANAVEGLTAVLLNINMRYKTHATLRLIGLDEQE